jgi:hypothetical protein
MVGDVDVTIEEFYVFCASRNKKQDPLATYFGVYFS